MLLLGGTMVIASTIVVTSCSKEKITPKKEDFIGLTEINKNNIDQFITKVKGKKNRFILLY